MMDAHFTIEEVEESAAGERAERDNHLAECARCANAVVAALHSRRAVRDAMAFPAASSALRLRLMKQARAPRVMAPWWITVAAVLGMVVVLSTTALRRESQPALPELIDMHVTMLAGANPVDVISTNRHSVRPWFEGRVSFGVPVPDLASTPFQLIGGRVVYWHGSQVAYLLVGKGAHRISVFVLRPQDAPKTLGTAGPSLNALSWQDFGLTFIAVADTPPADLDQLRNAFHRQ
jgi:anti-sigma factor RsiW